MKKEDQSRIIREVIDAEIRKENLGIGADVLNMLPALMECMTLDKNVLLQFYEETIKHGTNASFSSFLGIIKTKKAIRSFENRIADEKDLSTEISKSFLQINNSILTASVEQIGSKLSEFENRLETISKSQDESVSGAASELNRIQQELSHLYSEYEFALNSIAQRAQYAFSVAGEGETKNVYINQLMEMLSDLDMEVHWSANNTSFKESQLFTILKTDPTVVRNGKPAIVQRDRVISKGIKYMILQEES